MLGSSTDTHDQIHLNLERGDPARDSLLPQSGSGRTILGNLPQSPCSSCCFGTGLCSFMHRFFKSCPRPSDFTNSEVVSTRFLLCWRLVTAFYMFVVGFLFEWGAYPGESFSYVWSAPPRDATDDDVPNMPPAYLTNWGFLTVLVYFILASSFSVSDALRTRRERSAAANNSILQKGSSTPPPSLTAAHCVTWYVFVLASTLQPFIVLGFWALVYPYSHSCDFRCATVHVLACVAIWIELVICNLSVDVALLPLVIMYPMLWTVSQLIWIYSGHKPDYEVLPMDNLFSLGVSVGAMLFVTATFFLVRHVARWRDRRSGKERLTDLGVYYRQAPASSFLTTATHSESTIHF